MELLMGRAGLQGVTGRPSSAVPCWRPEATASDLVKGQFTRASCDQLWITDSTEHPPREGRLSCAVVLDACWRRVVGWSIDTTRPRRWSQARSGWRSGPTGRLLGR